MTSNIAKKTNGLPARQRINAVYVLRPQYVVVVHLLLLWISGPGDVWSTNQNVLPRPQLQEYESTPHLARTLTGRATKLAIKER